MTSNLQVAKLYFETLFSAEWAQTPIHFAGQDFDTKWISKWVNPVYRPSSGTSSGLTEHSINSGSLWVGCWADSDVDAFELVDNIVLFINQEVSDDYETNGFSIEDHYWDETGKTYVMISFDVKMTQC